MFWPPRSSIHWWPSFYWQSGSPTALVFIESQSCCSCYFWSILSLYILYIDIIKYSYNIYYIYEHNIDFTYITSYYYSIDIYIYIRNHVHCAYCSSQNIHAMWHYIYIYIYIYSVDIIHHYPLLVVWYHEQVGCRLARLTSFGRHGARHRSAAHGHCHLHQHWISVNRLDIDLTRRA